MTWNHFWQSTKLVSRLPYISTRALGTRQRSVCCRSERDQRIYEVVSSTPGCILRRLGFILPIRRLT